MAALGALVLLLSACLVSAYPSTQLADFPENARGGMSRIVSGWEAKDGQIPYQISLRMVAADGLVFGCGATVIHNEWALTAAHCTANRVTIVLRFGGVDLSRPSLIFETTDYYNHPLYIEALAGIVQPNDIGVVKFNRFVEYTDVIKPIRLQSSVDKNFNYNDVRLEASGWGRTWTNGPSPQILNWVYLTGVSNFACRYLFSSIVIDSTICAGAYNVSSQSTCQGDSGGPLVVVDQDGQLTQVGISSFVSRTGCHTDYPAGFIRPGHYHNWFTDVTGINFDWDFSQVTTIAPETEGTSPSTTTVEVEEEDDTSEEDDGESDEDSEDEDSDEDNEDGDGDNEDGDGDNEDGDGDNEDGDGDNEDGDGDNEDGDGDNEDGDGDNEDGDGDNEDGDGDNEDGDGDNEDGDGDNEDGDGDNEDGDGDNEDGDGDNEDGDGDNEDGDGDNEDGDGDNEDGDGDNEDGDGDNEDGDGDNEDGDGDNEDGDGDNEDGDGDNEDGDGDNEDGDGDNEDGDGDNEDGDGDNEDGDGDNEDGDGDNEDGDGDNEDGDGDNEDGDGDNEDGDGDNEDGDGDTEDGEGDNEDGEEEEELEPEN